MTTEVERRDPWLKFFHTDWQADEGLQMCSLAARGLWFELILYMHKAEPYGHLVINGRAPTTDELMRRLRPKSKRELLDALDELKTNQVYSITDAGVIFCRRMVRQGQRVKASRENGVLGGRPKNLNGNLDRNLAGNLEPNLDRNLEKTPIARSRNQKLETRNQKQKEPPPPFGASKHPIFKGARFTVFDWFLNKAAQILGKNLDTFNIDAWFYALDDELAASKQVVPTNDNGRWLADKLTAEARRRGLQMVTSEQVGGDPYARFSTAWTCAKCGEIHEGTPAQKREGVCLKKAAS